MDVRCRPVNQSKQWLDGNVTDKIVLGQSPLEVAILSQYSYSLGWDLSGGAWAMNSIFRTLFIERQ